MAHLIWLTGLSGSGKSTIANFMKDWRPNYVVLDGDVLRKGLCSDLGFSIEGRKENMRRLVELCELFIDAGHNVITAFISPFEETRQQIKTYIDKCYIVYCKASLEECERRDPKGLYKKARAGEIKEFTGIDSPYEVPKTPDIVLDTENQTPCDSGTEIIRKLIDDREG